MCNIAPRPLSSTLSRYLLLAPKPPPQRSRQNATRTGKAVFHTVSRRSSSRLINEYQLQSLETSNYLRTFDSIPTTLCPHRIRHPIVLGLRRFQVFYLGLAQIAFTGSSTLRRLLRSDHPASSRRTVCHCPYEVILGCMLHLDNSS